MKAFRLLAFAIGCTSSMAVASTPATVSGLVYTETTSVLITSGRGGTTDRLLLLRSDGRYSGLYRSSVALIPGGLSAPLTSIPPDGTWSYSKVGETTAQLTLSGTTYPLTFTSDTSGTISSTGGNTSSTAKFGFTTYDSSPEKLTNCSSRSFVSPGRSISAGFVLTSGERRVLVRAIGPTLQAFGITEVLHKPVLKVTRVSTNQTLGTNAGWSVQQPLLISPVPELAIVNQRAGAFPLPANSVDSVLFLSLTAGAYVAEVTSSDATDSGQVLIEVYMLP